MCTKKEIYTLFVYFMDKKLIINKIQDEYHLQKDADFAEMLGISKQTLSNWKSRNSFDIELLYTKCEFINPVFLLTGKEPIRLIPEKTLEEENNNGDNNGTQIFKLKTDRLVDNQAVPLYNLEATAGVVALFNDYNETQPVDYIKIPNLPKCDGALYVTGDSMYPLLKSGDIVMYKQVVDIENDIFWGEMYLVGIDLHGEEHVLVKYIQKSEKEGYVKLVSQNKHHQDKDIKVSKIKALALVKASIRINSMS